MRIHSFLLTLLILSGFAMAQSPVISVGGVVNGASFSGTEPITPGSLFTIFGTNLASTTAGASSIPLSTSDLGGVTVTFQNGSTSLQAPMLFVTGTGAAGAPGQINAQVPWEIVAAGATANVNVTVTNNGATSQVAQVTVGPFSPAIFGSSGMAIAENQDGTLTWAAGTVPGLTTHPAKAGDVITIFATGLGGVTPAPPADGANSLDQLRNCNTPPVVMIGGLSAQILFCGLSPQFTGVNQLNVVVPNVAAGNTVSLQLIQNGITTPNNTAIGITQ